MTIQEFKTKNGLEKINFYSVDGHLYVEPINVKLEVNKNINLDDLKDPSKLSIIQYYNGFVLSKDGNVEPYGIKLSGHWNEGFALDLHTLSSFPIKDAEGNNITNNYGNIQWDTKRPPIAEELYKLKYWKEKSHVNAIAKYAGDFINRYKGKWQLDLIIPIPPSDLTRTFQPVYEMAQSIGIHCSLPVDFKSLVKLKTTSQLKEIDDPEIRKEVLKDAFSIKNNILEGKDVLLFDDLYRSGETLNAVCDVIQNIGKARGVYILTITKTRIKK